MKKLSKIQKNRKNIIQEIIKTETDYIDKLSLMLEVYKPQLKKKNIISEKEVDMIFGNGILFSIHSLVGLIYNINRSLLENLKILNEDKLDEMKNRRTSKITALKKLKNDSVPSTPSISPQEKKLKEEEEEVEEFVKVSSPELVKDEEEHQQQQKDIFQIEKKRSSFSEPFKKLTPRSQSDPSGGSSPNKSPRKTTRSQTVILQKDTSGFLEKLFSPRSKKNPLEKVTPVVVVETTKKNLQFNSGNNNMMMAMDTIPDLSPLTSPRLTPFQKEVKKSNQIMFIPREQQVRH
jgi:hypothetical protein